LRDGRRSEKNQQSEAGDKRRSWCFHAARF
jgi:hypothetical protein